MKPALASRFPVSRPGGRHWTGAGQVAVEHPGGLHATVTYLTDFHEEFHALMIAERGGQA